MLSFVSRSLPGHLMQATNTCTITKPAVLHMLYFVICLAQNKTHKNKQKKDDKNIALV